MLNDRPDLDINQLSEDQKDKTTYYERDDEWALMTYQEIADENDGKIPWNVLKDNDKQLANPYYCDPHKGCLASSYDAYDKIIGQRYPSVDFLTETKLKNNMDLL